MLRNANFVISIGAIIVIVAPNFTVSARSCDGYVCSPPKECCAQGCCYLFAPPSAPKTQTSNNTSHVLNLFFINHWFFWCTIFALVIAILCACSLWKKRRQICGWGSPRSHSQTGDSVGSCYVPPQYSRCNSFHHAPPPYAEVTTKPDLYPLVFTCNNSDNGKNSSGYLMVQYFRNYIVRPVGSLSATSTVDSLSSSFICNANEANTLIPPPYSRAGSPLPMSVQGYGNAQVPRSASQQIEQMQQHGPRAIPILVTNGNNSGNGGEQIIINRPYHGYMNGPSGIDEHFVQYQPRIGGNSVSQHRLHDATTNADEIMSINQRQPNTQPDSICRVQIVRANSADTATTTAQLMTNTYTNDTHVSSTSDISNQCDVIEQTIRNNTTIAHDLTSNNNNNNHNTSTNAKPKHFSYATTNGLFNSYESIDDVIGSRFGMNLPIASQLRTPSAHSIGQESAEMLSMRTGIDGDRYGGGSGCVGGGSGIGIGDREPLEKSRSLPFSEESPVNADMLKKYGLREFADSMSGSAVSSLANFDYPTSPPQATTPTGEIRELLEQIRQLQENADSGSLLDDYPKRENQSGAATTISNESSSVGNGEEYDGDESSTSNGTNRMPAMRRPSSLHQNRRCGQRARFFVAGKNIRSPIGNGNFMSFTRNRKGWISKSAPTTPGTAMPSTYLNDDSPLLNEHDEDEQNA